MIEITSLSIEGVGVGILVLEVVDQVGVIIARAGGIIGARQDLSDRIFHGIGVQVAHDDKVRVAAASWIGGEPVH